MTADLRTVGVALLLDVPEFPGPQSHGRRQLRHDVDPLPVLFAGEQPVEDLDPFFLSVDPLPQRRERCLVRPLAEILEDGLEMVEIRNVLDRRAGNRHVPVQHIRRVVTRQTNSGDQKHKRHDEKQDLGHNPAALKNSVDKGHADPDEKFCPRCLNICRAAGRSSRVMPDGDTLSDIS